MEVNCDKIVLENVMITDSDMAKSIVDSDAAKKKRKHNQNYRRNLRKRVFEKGNGKCVCCNRKLQLNDSTAENYMTIDHIQSKHFGGKNTFENYQPMCRRCNSLKGDWDYQDWQNEVIKIGMYLYFQRLFGKIRTICKRIYLL